MNTAAPGTGPKVVELAPQDELKGLLDQGERNMPERERHYRQLAHLYRVFYSALLEEGFEEDQAIELTQMEFAN